jgi:L-amino acid N-acyltransferase YncA
MSLSVSIRPATPLDLPAMLALYAPYVEKTAVSFELTVPTLAEFGERYKARLGRYPWLVAVDDVTGDIVGYAYLGPFKERAAYDVSAEISVYVAHGVQRKGVGAKLYKAIEAEASLRGIRTIQACIAYPVDGKEDETLTLDSVHFHQRMGYRLCAHFHQCAIKFDRWYDMIWMEKHLGKGVAALGEERDVVVAHIMEQMIDFSHGNLHDITHLMKVWGFARTIGVAEKLSESEQLILECAAILHDIACPRCREKYGVAEGWRQEQEGAPMAWEFLQDSPLSEEQKERISFLVGHHHTLKNIQGRDYQILVEADFLVNAEESGFSPTVRATAKRDFFRTPTGIRLLTNLFPREEAHTF